MTWTAFDLSRAVRSCREVADEYGWESRAVGYDAASFTKGDQYVMVFITINGGLKAVHADQGHYRGPNRAAWVRNYLRDGMGPKVAL